MSKFAAIPNVPFSGLPEWKIRLYNAMKQNVELLIAQRNEADQQSKALLTGEFSPPTAVSGSVLMALTPALTSGIDNLRGYPAFAIINSITVNATYVENSVSPARWDNFETSASFRATGTSVRSLKEDVAILHDRVNNLVDRLRS